jgi:DNA transformation protein and related proteins
VSLDTGLVDWVEEASAPLGTVTWRKMMGGATFYLDGTVYAIIAGDALWFKADAESDAEWDAMGAERFSMVDKSGATKTMNYRRAPDDSYDDSEAFRACAERGLAAGWRAAR